MVNRNLSIENGHIAFRNFSGKETRFKRAGTREFCFIFDREEGERLHEEGWNVGILPPREEGDEPAYKLPVTVMFGKYPPKIYMISGRTKTLLDEDTVNTLDYAEIENVDAIVRPYNWEVNGKSGVKAYLHTLYVVIRQDNFASKYDFGDEEIPF